MSTRDKIEDLKKVQLKLVHIDNPSFFDETTAKLNAIIQFLDENIKT